MTFQTAFVTGSTSGIGEAIARTLAAAGLQVVVSGRDAGRGEAVVASIREAGGRADFVAGDLAGPYAELRRLAQAAAAVLNGHVDVLVNNAGVYTTPATVELADADLDTMLAVNLRAPHVLVAELVPGMIERGGGSIVTIGSWMGDVGSPFAAMYTATKAGDAQLTRTWAAEFGRRGVRAVTVAPGATLTPGNEAYLDVLNAMTAGTPGGRPTSPQDIADAVAWVVSDQARMVQGSTLYVDGGITATRS